MTFFDAADEVWIPQAKVEETVREYGYKGKLTVVENGIDLEMSDFASIKAFKAEQRLKLGYTPETMVLLFVGQHIREKGVLLIIRAMDKLRDLPVKMEFIGTGYATEEMKNLIRQLHLEDKVTLNGVISDREVLKSYYGAADMFLFPSRYDNAPLVVREAAMMGTPAVLIAGSTASEVIKDGFNGFLVEESPESYASRIRSLYNDRSAIQEAAEGASKTLTRSWREVMEEVVGRYEEIIERYGRR